MNSHQVNHATKLKLHLFNHVSMQHFYFYQKDLFIINKKLSKRLLHTSFSLVIVVKTYDKEIINL